MASFTKIIKITSLPHAELMTRGPFVRYDDMETGTMRAMQ